MFSSLTRRFCKTAECPTSEALLAYQRSLMTRAIPIFIADHLASCDFCGAELQLLKHYRSEPEEYSFTPMPIHLRRLAEALLKTTTVPFGGMAELVENQQAWH